MKTPPLLTLCALLLWGWQAEMLPWAALMGVLLELSRLVSTRWELSDSDLNRVWDLCGLLFLGAAVIIYTSEDVMDAFAFARWQPFIFFPMMLAQAWSAQEKIALRTFSWLMRRSSGGPLADKRINISFLYFAVCIMGASAANQRSPWFYPAMAALVLLALKSVQPRRLSTPAWLTLACLVAVAGHTGQEQLRVLQSKVESAVGNWLGSLARGRMDFGESRTAIGRIGRIKLSGKIVLRVDSEPGSAPPPLLREMSFDGYRHGLWSASKTALSSTVVDTNDAVSLLPEKVNASAASISRYLPKGRGLLALPHGTFEMRNLPVALETSPMGVAKVTAGPGFVNFTARFGPGESLDAPPDDADLAVPEPERAALAEIAGALNLDSKSESEKIQTIARYFQDHFSYSLYLGESRFNRAENETALSRFLRETRAGHCEYFATATALLLRQAGIPARYATGYAVQEPAGNGKTFVVRERHAHAWTMVYRDDKGAWEDLDTTPASWNEIEETRASFFEPISDAFSRLWLEFSKWRWSKANRTRYLVALLIPLVLFLVWRIIFNKQRRRTGKARLNLAAQAPWPGTDSEFYLLERKLAEQGLERAPDEPLNHWKQRVFAAQKVPSDALDTALQLHLKYRFDPRGLTPAERGDLRENTTRCVEEMARIR